MANNIPHHLSNIRSISQTRQMEERLTGSANEGNLQLIRELKERYYRQHVYCKTLLEELPCLARPMTGIENLLLATDYVATHKRDRKRQRKLREDAARLARRDKHQCECKLHVLNFKIKALAMEYALLRSDNTFAFASTMEEIISSFPS
jgi:hypothetical protein